MSTTLPSGPDADDLDPRRGDFASPENTAALRDPHPIARARDSRLGRTEVSGRSHDEAARLSGRYLGGALLEATPDSAPGAPPFSFRFASVGDDNVTLRVSTITGSLRGRVSRLDGYVVTWFRDGGGVVATGRSSVDVAPGQPVALPSSSPFSFEARSGRQNLVQVGRVFLDGVATERHGGLSQPITFRHDIALDPRAVADWWRVVSAASPVISDLEAAPLLRMEACLALTRSMLSTFPWHTQLVPPALLAPRLARVRAAVEFLHDNAHLPITPADAAAAAQLHTRSMQNAFRRHLDMSPTEYLRRIRLDRVRRDLLEHSPKTATVNDLARAWGFGNLGRFASAYQQQFGEKPNETLRR